MGKSRILIFLLILTLLSILSVYYPEFQDFTGKAVQVEQYEKEQALLTRVVDGDTIHALIDGKDQTIRLLGINTPEKNMPYADSAKNFLKKFENKSIYLLRDKENLDKYNRSLRYIFYESRFLNLEILEQGFANAYYTEELTYKNQLLRAESQARELEAGIWEKSQEPCAKCITLVSLEPEKETFILKNSCSFNCELGGWFVKDAGRNTFYLNPIKEQQEQTITSEKDVWNNYGDNFFLFDNNGKLVLFYSY
jgi:micrococcal nuclease